MGDNQIGTRTAPLQVFGSVVLTLAAGVTTISAFVDVPTIGGIIRRITTRLLSLAGTVITSIDVDVSDDQEVPTALNRIIQRAAIGPGTVPPEIVDDFDVDPPRAFRWKGTNQAQRRVRVDATQNGGDGTSNYQYLVEFYGDAQG